MTPAEHTAVTAAWKRQNPERHALHSHLSYYRRHPECHKRPCPRCAHYCPMDCIVLLHDPYQVLCGYHARMP